MRKAPNITESKDMLPEYDFDYSKARPNRFAGDISEDRRVVLPPESEDVNEREWLQAASKNEAFDLRE
ncbi:MAG: hypothetical protein HOP19_05370 [Acidobacteria bacterium]|nr:hypothetical protein [Acidobacteriota bacterium]